MPAEDGNLESIPEHKAIVRQVEEHSLITYIIA